MDDTMFINVKRAAAELGVKVGWVYERVQNGKIPHYKRGKNILFRIDEIEQLKFQRILE